MEDLAWVDAMVEEYDSIFKNSAWDIVSRSEGKSVVGSIWIYKVKQVADGSVEKYKARFVARGFSQIKGSNMKKPFHLSQGILAYGPSFLSQRGRVGTFIIWM